MSRVGSLLAESDLSAVAFSIIERFSTHRCIQAVIAELMNTIGSSLRLWAHADVVAHVFTNPQFGATGQCHRLICHEGRSLSTLWSACPYEAIDGRLVPPKFTPLGPPPWKPSTWRLPKDLARDDVKVCLSPEVLQGASKTVRIVRFDFVNPAPLGFFSAAWIDRDVPAESDLSLIQDSLWNLARVVSALLCNQYTIHQNTYLPSFQLEGDKSVAILFADIRNSTTLFELARVAKAEVVVECLLRAWFRYAAELIARSGLGNLHRFTGDGLAATFGEYLIGTPELQADEAACVLALYAARQLLEAFDRLYETWRRSQRAARFLRDTNEDVEVRLGVGLDCGEVRFAYIGRPSAHGTSGGAVKPGDGAHLEYCAFGDHMNTGARLADLATKPAREIDISHRGPAVAGQFRMAPVIASHRVVERLRSVLPESPSWLDERRGRVLLRGKGLGQTLYEIDRDSIDRARCSGRVAPIAGGFFKGLLDSPPRLDDHVLAMNRELAGAGD